MKQQDQKRRDKDRKTYKLSFPTDLNDTNVTSWIRAISGTLRASKGYLGGVPTVAFELWATSTGIEHRLKVPWQYADYIVSQLRSLVPGIRVTPDDEYPRRLWSEAIEVGMSKRGRPLRIFSAADMSASILAAVQALENGETLMMQWVVTPAVPSAKPIYKDAASDRIAPTNIIMGGNVANRDEINDRRMKLEEPNVMATLRIGSVAKTTIRAQHLINRVKSSLAQARTAHMRFTKRIVSKRTLQQRIDLTSGSLMFPMQLSAPELTALIGWPIGNPHVSGLPPSLARQLPASDLVPREGRIIGNSNFPGNERPIAIGFEEARKHVHIVGPTGVGKTVMLGNMLKQDIEQGYGAILIENKGDLFKQALDYIPWERLDDVVVLDATDTKWPVGFNILTQGDPLVVVDEVVALFEHLYKDARGVWTREVLYHALRTLASDPKYTFIDLGPLLVPMSPEEIAWADDLIRSLEDRELRNFWQRFQNQPRAAQDRYTQPVMDRIWQLNARPEIRNIIGQSKSAFDMSDIVKNNKILLVNLSGLPRDTASLTGTLLINAIWHGVKTTQSNKPTFLYLDEFQDFLSLPVDPEDMLAKARGFGLGMTLAHQHLGQLPNDMKGAILANARTKVVFQTTSDDARTMAREFGDSVTENDFMHLGRYEALARVATGDGVSQPLSLASKAPLPGHNYSQELRQRSRNAHGRPVRDVEAEISKRRAPGQVTKTRKRPQIGGSTKWGD